MIEFLLDTDTLSLNQGGHNATLSKVRKHSPTLIGTSIISIQEQLTGWQSELQKMKLPNEWVIIYSRMTKSVQFLKALPIISFPEESVGIYQSLRKYHRRTGSMDLRIASIALANDLTLVTRNTQDFEGIHGLKLENWSI